MDKQQNKHSRIMIAVLLMILMVFSAGCSHQPVKPTESTPDTTQNTKPATDTTTVPATDDTSEITDASLNSLRQAMAGTSQLFAVAYFGYHDTIDSDAPVDPYEVMTQDAPQLCADLPFLLDIPADRVIGETWVWQGYLKNDLKVSYSVTFNHGYLNVRWNDGIDAMEHVYDNAPWTLEIKDGYAVLTIDFAEFAGVLRYDVLYSQFYDELYIAQDVLQEDMNIGWEPLCRYMTKPIAPKSIEMAGIWELAWTEIEGYQEEAEPGTCFLEITTDDEGLFWVSYTDYAFPDDNYENKELVVFPWEMYYGCGNDQWTATVNHTGKFGTEYHITLLYNDTLLLQRYWEVDGAPMVSYASYSRVAD